MASYINLDSIFRDRQNYPNPAEFQVSADLIKGWHPNPPKVNATNALVTDRSLEFASTLKLMQLIIPYSANLLNQPCLYVSFFSSSYKDTNIVGSMTPIHAEDNFICNYSKTQYDNLGNPIWLHYDCKMRVTMRFRRNSTVLFKVSTRSGASIPDFIDTNYTIPADPTKQVLATFEIIPFIRNNAYTNHLVEPIQI